jgi:cell division control protein 6
MKFEGGIFKNEEVLSPEYLPEFLPHRENQIHQLANNLLPAAKKRKPQNTFIYGSPGIGKTACVKFVFREFEKYSDKVKTVYVNCWDYKTVYSNFTKIANELGIFAPRRGWSKDEILEKIIEWLGRTKKSLIICFDEVDQLEEETIYDWLRINQYVKNPIGLVFVSNHKDVFIDKEPRIRSSLDVEEIEFKPYSLNEMIDILKERAKLAFIAFENAVIILAANHAVNKGGDVRVGLQCLFKAGRMAENEGVGKVKVEHVKRILRKVREVKPKLIEEKLSEIERTILNLVRKRNYTSGELYKEVSKRGIKISERKFRDYLNNLAKRRLIKVKEKRLGIRGFTRIISKF